MKNFEIYRNGRMVQVVPANSAEEALSVSGWDLVEGAYAVLQW